MPSLAGPGRPPQYHLFVKPPLPIDPHLDRIVADAQCGRARMPTQIPGLAIPVWFTPTRVGDYELACAQLCGVGHAIMRADVKVQPRAELDEWLRSKKTTALAAAPKAAVEQW